MLVKMTKFNITIVSDTVCPWVCALPAGNQTPTEIMIVLCRQKANGGSHRILAP
jgi:hypothetical protein